MSLTRYRFLSLPVALLAAAACMTASRSPSTGLHPAGELGVARIWHGRTPRAKADEYEKYLYSEGIAKIRKLPGNLGVQVLRRDEKEETDFLVVSYWPSRQAVREWAGEEIEKTRYLAKDREYLLELEPTVRHYDVIVAEGRTTSPKSGPRPSGSSGS
jgi:heme-degrading monooxygenase HmoA